MIEPCGVCYQILTICPFCNRRSCYIPRCHSCNYLIAVDKEDKWNMIAIKFYREDISGEMFRVNTTRYTLAKKCPQCGEYVNAKNCDLTCHNCGSIFRP